MYELEAIDSSLISHRGHDAATNTLLIRFRTKTGISGSLYSYANVSPEFYQQGIDYKNADGEASFGQFFNRYVKADPKNYPFTKLEEVGAVPVETVTPPQVIAGETTQTTDFASGQPIPVDSTEIIVIPVDIEELKVAAEELAKKAKSIPDLGQSQDRYRLAEATAIACVRMRDALEKTMRPIIEEARKPYTDALAVFNSYHKPLESDEKRLREAMRLYNVEARRIQAEEASRLRRIQEGEEEAKARIISQELQLADAVEAEQRGEPELAASILAAAPLPIRPAYVPPVHVPLNVPKGGGSSHVEDWTFEFIDEQGNPEPTGKFVPDEYKIIDVKAIAKVVKILKGRTDIKGLRVYDQGSVRLKK